MDYFAIFNINFKEQVRDACFFIYLGFYVAFNATGHITTGSWKGRGNQYIQLFRFCTVNCRPMASNYLGPGSQRISDLA